MLLSINHLAPNQPRGRSCRYSTFRISKSAIRRSVYGGGAAGFQPALGAQGCHATERAKRYTVFVKDLATGEEIQGQPTGETTWASDKELIRGHQYGWMVEAATDGQRVRAPAPNKPFPTFRVLDEQKAREISLAWKEWNSSHLVMGLIYAQAGLIREAEKELRELVAANPESSTARSRARARSTRRSACPFAGP